VTKTRIKTAGRVGAAAVALGLSLAGPQAVGVASADSPDTGSASVSGSTAPSDARTAREPVSGRSAPERTGRAPGSSARRGAQIMEPDAAALPPAVVPAEAAAVEVADESRPVTATGRGQSGPSEPAALIGSDLLDPAATAQSESEPSALAWPAAGGTPASDPVGSQPTPSAAATENDAAPPVGRNAMAAAQPGTGPQPSVPNRPYDGDSAWLPTPPALAAASLPEPPAATATPSGVLWDINTAVVGVLDATQNWLSTLPANPISELLEGALLLVRRNLFSQPATVDPVQTITTATGQIRGTLGAISPQGSPLSYTLTSDPLLGTVEVSPDGTYVYTPGTDFSEYDTFSVAVDSPGFNIFNPSGSWRPAQASVSVWGSPGDGGPPDGALAKPLITRTFEIINLTSSNQMLGGWTAQANRTVVQVAPVGTILKPGESTKIVLAQYAFQDLVGTATFTPVDASGIVTAAPSGSFSVVVATKPFGSVWRCDVGNCNTGTTRTVVLLDRPGTVISVPSGQGQKQADVLNGFCNQGLADCSFVPRSFDNAAWSLPQQASDSIRNNTTSPVTSTVTVTNTQSTATSLKLASTIKASLFKVVEASVTAEASQTWTNTYTFSQSYTITAQPGQEVFFVSSTPVKAVTGDFIVSVGVQIRPDGTVGPSSTWNLYDVTFDSPDPSRRARWCATTPDDPCD
jgi:hypothetical protein